FDNCISLESISIPDSVKSIGAYGFGGCKKLTSISIPDSVTSIGEGAFNNCSSLSSVIIPGSVASIGDYAFYNCSSLAEVFYAGSAADWSSITVGEGNDHLTSATRYFYSEEEPTESGNYWHYVDGVPTVW
ncbi:MAG: leucine-rich repeat domain-containing protein, partial [Candidatus Enteromonas sp.]|nr:leucine-rich repeat domain-containing protein [Candidatus Enteromonas sp.]